MNLFNMTDMGRSAELSDCGKYRFQLARCWRPEIKQLGWIMLNPSTADALADDPTIRRCMTFARDWGFGGIMVVNLFNLRATNPDELSGPDVDPWGCKDWEKHYDAVFAKCARVMAAWGSHRLVDATGEHNRLKRIALGQGRFLHCLAVNADGHPRHPLYVKADTQPMLWFDPRKGVADRD